jgi:hypothetical protein
MTDVGLDELLQPPTSLDVLAPEPRLLRHDEDLKRSARLERVHHADEPGSLDELDPDTPSST